MGTEIERKYLVKGDGWRAFDDGCPAGQTCVGVPNACAGGPGGPGACFRVCPE